MTPVEVEYFNGVPYLTITPSGGVERELLSGLMSATRGNTLSTPFTFANEVQLKLKGYDVPNYLEGYDWPGRFRPWAHQRATTNFMLQNDRCWILNEPRTGKSLSTIWGIHRAMLTGDVKRVLILAPKTILQSTWQRELFWVMPHVEVYIANRTVKELEQVLSRPDGGPPIIVANHDKIKFSDALYDRRFDLVVPDEASKFKHARSDRSRCFAELVKRPSTKLWALTGTPCSTSPMDVWNMGRHINQSRFPKYYGHWRAKTMFQIPTTGRWKPKCDWEDTVATALNPSYRVRRKDCFDVPPISYTFQAVDLVPEQKQAIRGLMKSKRTELRNGNTINAVHAASEVQKVMQIAGGVVYDSEGRANVIQGAVTKRCQAIVDAQEQSGRKVLVVCAYKSMIQSYVETLSNMSGTEVLKLDGSVSPKNRMVVTDRFATDPEVLFTIAHPEPVQFGVNMSQANTTVWVTPTANPEAWTQTNDRMFAEVSEQKDKLDVIMLAGCKAEQRAYNNFRKKELGQLTVLDSTELYEAIFGEDDAT